MHLQAVELLLVLMRRRSYQPRANHALLLTPSFRVAWTLMTMWRWPTNRRRCRLVRVLGALLFRASLQHIGCNSVLHPPSTERTQRPARPQEHHLGRLSVDSKFTACPLPARASLRMWVAQLAACLLVVAPLGTSAMWTPSAVPRLKWQYQLLGPVDVRCVSDSTAAPV
jgi:hypothetical protein